MQYIETLEEKRKEISALADIDNYEKMMLMSDGSYNEEDSSKTRGLEDVSCKDCERFAAINTVTGNLKECPPPPKYQPVC